MAKKRQLPGVAFSEPASRIVGQILGWHLEDADSACGRLRSESDSEALHDFRVASRRFRSTVRTYRDVVSEDLATQSSRLADVVRPTNDARDAEVQLEWLREHKRNVDGCTDFIMAIERGLEARRDRGYEEGAKGAVAGYSAIADELGRSVGFLTRSRDSQSNESFLDVLPRHVLHRGRKLVAKLGQIESPDDVRAAHKARISAKRLRYVLEPTTHEIPILLPLTQRMKGLQDLLGDQRDIHSLRNYILVRERGPELKGMTCSGLKAMLQDQRYKLFSVIEETWLGDSVAALDDEIRSLAERIGLLIPEML